MTLLCAAPAFADNAPSASDVKRAADEFDRGRVSYREEQYVEAAEHFEAADAHAPSAAALRLAITSRKEAGQLDRAATLAALALNRHADDAELSELSNGVIEEANNLHRVEVSCSEACELAMDSKIVHGGQNVSRVLYLTPGSHRITASWSNGRTSSESVSASAGGTSRSDFTAPEIPSSGREVDTSDVSAEFEAGPTDPAEDKKGGWSPTVFWTGLGLTAAGGVATGVLGVIAMNNPGPDKVRSACKNKGPDCPEYKQGLDNQRNANIALGVTGVLGAFTIVTGLFLTDWSSGDVQPAADEETAKNGAARRSAKSDFSVRPWVEFGDGASLGATGTF